MTREVVLELWLEGGRLNTIARLLGEDPHGVEDAVRMELNRLRNENTQDQPEPCSPAPAEARTEAADSSPRPARNRAAAMKRDPVRRRIEAALDLTGYPEVLQDPRAETQRDIFDALKRQPQTVTQLAQELERDSGKVFQAIQKLRAKNLIRGSETTPVVWRIA